jgi:hypothetical protein
MADTIREQLVQLCQEHDIEYFDKAIEGQFHQLATMPDGHKIRNGSRFGYDYLGMYEQIQNHLIHGLRLKPQD